MNRTSAILGTLVFLVLLPGTVAGLVPWWITQWEFSAWFPLSEVLRVVGVLLILGGLAALLDAFARFSLEGGGTPAPIAPTKHLVVRGPYRYVRNPMYVAVLALILGQTFLFGSLPLLVYGAAVWLACHLFVVFYEEPTLLRTYGDEYEAFRATVPRWIPRVRPARLP